MKNIVSFTSPEITVHVFKDEKEEKLPYKLVEKSLTHKISLSFSTQEEALEKFHDFVDLSTGPIREK